MKRFLIGVAAASLLAVLVQDVAVAAPTPVYDVTCVVGGQTSAIYRRAKLDQATFEWFTAGSTTAYVSLPVPISPHPPHGSIVTSAGTLRGIVPARVVVSFKHADGSGTDPVEVACT